MTTEDIVTATDGIGPAGDPMSDATIRRFLPNPDDGDVEVLERAALRLNAKSYGTVLDNIRYELAMVYMRGYTAGCAPAFADPDAELAQHTARDVATAALTPDDPALPGDELEGCPAMHGGPLGGRCDQPAGHDGSHQIHVGAGIAVSWFGLYDDPALPSDIGPSSQQTGDTITAEEI
jgi:hypothetical protein